MAYLLGDITLKSPASFVRRQVESSAENTSLTGRSTKDIFNRKEQYVLELRSLTTAQVNSVLGEYNLQATRNFEVTETNLTISATPVHIDIQRRDYYKGGDYREDITLTLTEVS